MDIRVVSESIFNIESDCIVYFVDNAFSNEDTMEIITKAGNRLLDVFSKISSLATGEFKTVPAFNLKATYVVLCSIPPKIEKEEDEKFLDCVYSLNPCFNDINSTLLLLMLQDFPIVIVLNIVKF